MKILVTGANGQVGHALRRQLADIPHACQFTDRETLDLRDEEAIREAVAGFTPEVVINAAAYTAVDKAETEVQRAVEVNQDAVRVLAKACHDHGARLLHISTDYVYHNGLDRPLREDDPTSPRSVYARTKLEGEREATSACANTVILRTSWVYGLEGHNFVRTMARLGQERDSLTVVSDQIGAPTFADDIAASLIHIAETRGFAAGTYNYAGLGVASWYDFAREIMRMYGLPCEVRPIPSEDYPTPAERPRYSVLDLGKAAAAGLPLRHWRDALADFHARDATRG